MSFIIKFYLELQVELSNQEMVPHLTQVLLLVCNAGYEWNNLLLSGFHVSGNITSYLDLMVYFMVSIKMATPNISCFVLLRINEIFHGSKMFIVGVIMHSKGTV